MNAVKLNNERIPVKTIIADTLNFVTLEMPHVVRRKFCESKSEPT